MPRIRKSRKQKAETQEEKDRIATIEKESGVIRAPNGRIVAGSVNRKWTNAEMLEKFTAAMERAYNGEFLSEQEAIMTMGISKEAYYDRAEKNTELKQIRDNIKVAIIAHLNRGALEGDLHPVAAIFRQKVEGEQEAAKKIDVTQNKEQPIIKIDDFQDIDEEN